MRPCKFESVREFSFHPSSRRMSSSRAAENKPKTTRSKMSYDTRERSFRPLLFSLCIITPLARVSLSTLENSFTFMAAEHGTVLFFSFHKRADTPNGNSITGNYSHSTGVAIFNFDNVIVVFWASKSDNHLSVVLASSSLIKVLCVYRTGKSFIAYYKFIALSVYLIRFRLLRGNYLLNKNYTKQHFF